MAKGKGNGSTEVQPIRNKKDINKMKKALHGRDRLLFIFGINTGLRISDILKLKVSDVINPDGTPKKSIRLQEKKTKKYKTIEFNKSILDELKQVEYREDGYLFPSRKRDKDGNEKPITRVQAYNILTAAAKKAGIEGEIGTHTLRKTFGYHMRMQGVPVEIIMRLLNHSSVKDTLRYIGIEQDELSEQYKALNL